MLFKRFRQARAQATMTPEAEAAAQRWRDAWKAMQDRVSLLETALRDLQAAHDTTVSQLNKLRGQVHGPRAQLRGVPTSPDNIPFGDKAALRALALPHGQRFVHPSETGDE